jgi:signal peptidase I
VSDSDLIAPPPPPESTGDSTTKSTATTEEPKKSGLGHWLWEVIQTLVLAGLLIVFFRSFIFQNYIVEGDSMVNTLHAQERLIVSRLSYILGEPERGDVIVFQYPYDPQRDFVKRIIGLPGETVAINNGVVFIDGNPLPDESLYVDYLSSESKPPVVLGDDEYYVMGDNRPGSSDSRSWGPLTGRNIIGKAWLIYFPFSAAEMVQHSDLEPQG